MDPGRALAGGAPHRLRRQPHGQSEEQAQVLINWLIREEVPLDDLYRRFAVWLKVDPDVMLGVSADRYPAPPVRESHCCQGTRTDGEPCRLRISEDLWLAGERFCPAHPGQAIDLDAGSDADEGREAR